MTANAAVRFVDRHRMERPDKTVFREADGARRSMTYGELAARTDQFAGALGAAGIRREERVMMLVLDQLEFPVIFWGAMKAGAVPVPVNTLLPTTAYREILADARAAALFVSAAVWPAVAPALSGDREPRLVVVIGDTAEGRTSWDAFMDGAEPRAAVDVVGDECGFWFYSSGSTGRPKGVRHHHGALGATAETYGARVLGVTEDDTVLSAAKLFFAYGLGNSMTFPMSVGATTVLLSGRPTPEAVSDALARERPTIFHGVPTLYAAMLRHWEDAPPPDAPLRRCVSAGEALPAETGGRWSDLWGVDILDGVGSTEMLHIFLSNRPGEVEYGTSGVAVPGYDLRLVNEDGADAAPGEIGELLVRGTSAADGYWNQRRKSRSTFEGEWTRTGDKYERRADGRYVYCGRTDDMFKVSGIWVSPFEVEQALTSHPLVLESAVVAARDADGLEKPKAYIVPRDAADPPGGADLKEYVKERVGKWKYPRWIEVVDDLPKTATGKIQRFKLREGA